MQEEYNHKNIEEKWQWFWDKNQTNEPDLNNATKPFYNLMMFPYPSAEGLHVGNMYAFVHSDAYGRFKRLQGYDVFEPIGLDGFGIHSENYAIKIGEHIRVVSRRTEANFYRQLRMIGNGYAWSHKIETWKKEYYKWTQWLFLQMYKKGLAYRAKAPVNWCPKCKTVLSDEQIIGGLCERCDSVAEKRDMEQWFFKITDYAEKLLANLDNIDWSDDVKLIQKNWIGKKEGAIVNFKINGANVEIPIFTTRPDTIFGASFLVVSPEHHFFPKLKNIPNEHGGNGATNWEGVHDYIESVKHKSDLERTDLNKDKNGIALNGIIAINPVNGEKVPVFVADYVLPQYGTGAIMAVPAHDSRDFDFAKKYNLPIKTVVVQGDDAENEGTDNCFDGDGINVNSGFLDGLATKEAKEKTIKFLEENHCGERKINYRLRDWCVSRQRYWGPPIPMIHCKTCGWLPVDEANLPVELPDIDDFLPDGSGRGPLAKVKEFMRTQCPKCGGDAEREADVSDPFVDSCWYFMRYPSAEFDHKPFDEQRTQKWLPVDMYIGGKEHSVLHLLYARFVNMVMHELGFMPSAEPFKKFRAHGLLVKDGAKISKSKGNIINPDEFIEKFGADTVRLYLMFMGDMRQGGDWRDDGVNGMHRFVKRVYTCLDKVHPAQNLGDRSFSGDIGKVLHKTIKGVAEDVENLKFNTAISKLMVLVNNIHEKGCLRDDLGDLVIMIAPFAPHVAEEIWSELGKVNDTYIDENDAEIKERYAKSVFTAIWPKFNEDAARDDLIELVIQINGKVRDKMEVAADIQENEARELSLARGKIQELLDGKKLMKVVFVPGRLVNIVCR